MSPQSIPRSKKQQLNAFINRFRLKKPSASLVALTLFFSTSLQPLNAYLDSIDRSPWFGYFASYTNKQFMFGFACTGEIKVTVLKRDKEPVIKKLFIPIVISVEEVLPNGKTVIKKMDPDSFESKQDPSDEFEKVVIHGEASDGIKFELNLEQNRGVISMGGRILEAGSCKNPLRISYRANFSDPYPYSRANYDEDATKAFEKKIRKDQIALAMTNNSDRKIGVLEELKNEPQGEPSSISEIAEATITILSFDGREFNFTASKGSTLTLKSKPRQALLEGFSLLWTPDPAKDPESKSRFSMSIR